MKNSQRLKLDMEAGIDGMLVDEIKKKNSNLAHKFVSIKDLEN